jgi:nucleoside-diphosphate-sugar epimerase
MSDKSTSKKSSHILVTGGTGFLGQRLVRRLLDQGYPVRIFARRPARPEPRREKLLATLVSGGAELAWGDLTNPAAVSDAVRGVDTIFHLAGRLLIWGAREQEYIDLHIEGTRNLLAACRRNGPLRRLVYCSSTGVLGPSGPEPLGEDAPLRPTNIYEATKAEGERLAHQAAGDGLPVVVARPALVYGPGDLHMLSWFQAIQRGMYRVVGRGDNLYRPIFVEDVTAGLQLCAEHPRAVGRTYHLVGDETLTIRQLSQGIADALDAPLHPRSLPTPLAYTLGALIEALPGLPARARPLTRSRVRFMTQNRVYSGERARQELGFTPRVSLARGLPCTVDWYRSQGLI